MAKMKDNDGQMSVDELVHELKESISSTNDVKKEKTILKNSRDPNKDIASMLKKFMPASKAEADDFELDDTTEIQASEFDLDGDAEYDTDSREGKDDAPLTDDVEEFVFDDNGIEEGDAFADDGDASASFDFAEPEPSADETAFDFDEAAKPEKKKLGGLFSGKKSKSLADGYAKMLEQEFGTPGAFAGAENGEKTPEVQMTEQTNTEVSEADEPNYTANADEANDEITDETADTEESDDGKAEDAPVATQVYVLETPEDKNEPEEEYFEPNDKKPLIFDDDDETPIVPDGSAFEDVARSDISDFEGDDGDENSKLDDKDINLMMALGYDDELEEKFGKEKIDKISDDLNSQMSDFIDVDNAFAFDGFELNSPDQYRDVGKRYKDEHKKIKYRLIGSTFFALVLLAYELFVSFDVTVSGALNIHHYPVVGIMLSLQMLVFSAVFSWRQLLSGLTDMITFTPSPNSIPAFAVISTVIYDIIMALIAPNTGLQLYNFPAALCILFLVVNDYFNLSREIRAFHIIATKAPKYALSVVSSREEDDVEREMAEIFSGSDEIPQSTKTLDSYKLAFTENYFRRTNIVSQKDRKLNIRIYPFLALAIALGVISFVTNHSAVTAFNISILTILLGTPLSMLFVGSYPFFSAEKTAFDRDAAIIGEASVEEYADSNVVTFSDSEVFPVESTVTRGIKLYDNNAIYYVLYHLTSIYSKIGGPLKVRLEQATAEMGYSDDVVFTRIEDNGIEATVDGKVSVLAGQAEFMASNGIQTGYDPDDDSMYEEGCSTLYLALDGVLCAKLYVKYDIDHSFEDVVNKLADGKMEAIIYTSDPCINDELLVSKLTTAKVTPHIVKCEAPNETGIVVDSAESGIVARHSLLSLVSTVILCDKIRRVRKTSKRVSNISMVISAIMMVFLALFSSKLGVPSFYVALYQIFWMLPMLLFTKLYIK